MYLDRELLAWAAGFYDGEGNVCFNIGGLPRRDGSKWKTPHIQIKQANSPDLLNKFRHSVGVGSVKGPYNYNKIKKEHWSPYYVYSAYGFENCQAVCAMLWNWLGSEKRQQFVDKLNGFLEQPRFKAGPIPK